MPCPHHTAGKPKRSVLADESDDDDLPNTYDYNDSFIDDEDVSEGKNFYPYFGAIVESDHLSNVATDHNYHCALCIVLSLSVEFGM